MLIYLLVVLLIVLFEGSLSRISDEDRRSYLEIRYMRIVCWILVLLAALRGISVGTDTLAYWPEYLSALPSMSFPEVLDKYADYPGYYLLAKTCSYLHLPVQVLFGIVEGIYVFAIYKFLCRYSDDKLFSLLCFTVIGLYAFSLAGLKQVLSMAFVLLYFMALDDRHILAAVLLAVIAYFCHHVSLIFLAGVALFYLRHLRFYYFYLAILVGVVLLGSRFLWSEMLSLLQNDHYTELYGGDEGYSSTSMIIYGFYLLLLFLFGGNYMKIKKEESRVMFGLSTLAFVFQAFSFVSSTAFRISYIFLPFMVVAFPNVFRFIDNPNLRKSVKIGMALALVFVFIYTNRDGGSVVPYKFFWQ